MHEIIAERQAASTNPVPELNDISPVGEMRTPRAEPELRVTDPVTGRRVEADPIAEHWSNRRPELSTAEPASEPASMAELAEEQRQANINDILERARKERKDTSTAALDKIEANKKVAPADRLKNLIGEERANKLTSGEVEIEHSEAPYRGKGKRLPSYQQKTWNEWAQTQLNGEAHAPDKPGLTVKDADPYWKKRLEVVYRDKDGKPIGVMKTDLSGNGISTLAVDPTLGLRRGKVAFEMLKEAFDRGITEPSGVTSDFTNNLIERVKRLARNDKGEFDMDAFNDLIEELSNMRMGPDEAWITSVMAGSQEDEK
jgi:hypothetical protein